MVDRSGDRILGSCIIELGQLLFLPARSASLGDIAANSTGAAIGVGIDVGIASLIQLAMR